MSNHNLFPSLVRLYHATFNREADKMGVGHWAKQLTSGLTLEDVAYEFIHSKEFGITYPDGLTSEGFVTLLYNNVLGRTPDKHGLDYWIEKLDAGDSQEHILLGFSESAENKKKLAEQVDDEVSALIIVDDEPGVYTITSEGKNGAQKLELDDIIDETVNIADGAVKAQIHNVDLGETVDTGDKIVLTSSVIGVNPLEDVDDELESTGDDIESLEFSEDFDLEEFATLLSINPENEWISFFTYDDKNKIEIEWDQEGRQQASDGEESTTNNVEVSHYDVELKLMYDGGFVKLHDIEIDNLIFESFFSEGDFPDEEGEFTMHRDHQNENLLHVDSEDDIGNAEGAIALVGHFIDIGLIDIVDSI